MMPLDVDRLRRLADKRSIIGRTFDHRLQTESTSDLAHAAWETASPALPTPAVGHVFVAESQTAGRGQRGRSWSAPAGSALLFSILLDPPQAHSAPSFITAWAAVGVAWTLRELGLLAVIKWPNDLLIDERKICGILVERRRATVVGIGLNVSIRPDQFPSDLRLPATSIQTELGRPIDRAELLDRLLDQLDTLYLDATHRGLEPLWQQWTELSQNLIGQNVRVTLSQGESIGTLLDLRPDRGARLRTIDGPEISFPSETIWRIDRLPSASSL